HAGGQGVYGHSLARVRRTRECWRERPRPPRGARTHRRVASSRSAGRRSCVAGPLGSRPFGVLLVSRPGRPAMVACQRFALEWRLYHSHPSRRHNTVAPALSRVRVNATLACVGHERVMATATAPSGRPESTSWSGCSWHDHLAGRVITITKKRLDHPKVRTIDLSDKLLGCPVTPAG